ncbi:hypothetical protein [Sebaldella sp. S0638]|uniref:hypothetical protein n=1 Tax=Sebaldella sp. S0638 TaxID=2957809 RepID=UPI00209FF42A|nr:hypothetical protein [Sebaldella sp. S0638]MCP1225366.1 hypothetical protein [Sebaldella sp. S0638]
MSKLTVIREKLLMNGGNYQIILDGKVIGEIGSNEAKTYEIPEGGHIVQVGRNRSFANEMSKELRINANQNDIIIKVRLNSLRWIFVFLYIMIAIIRFCFDFTVFNFLFPFYILFFLFLSFKLGIQAPTIEQLK